MGLNKKFHANLNNLQNVIGLIDMHVEKADITEKDGDLLNDFIDHLTLHDVTPQRCYKIISHLITLRQFIPPYVDCKFRDLNRGITLIKEAKKKDKDGNVIVKNGIEYDRFAQNTKVDIIRETRRFFLWIIDEKKLHNPEDIPKDKVMSIKTPKANKLTVKADEIYTKEEIASLIKACANSMERALVATLYEGGFRAQEIGNLTWADLRFEDTAVIINTAEKTGRPRHISIVAYKQYLKQWREDYPLPLDDDNFVFINNQNKVLQYNTLVKRLRTIGERAGFKKEIRPHLFRHSRITHLANDGMKEVILKQMLWGNASTDMMSRYAHLSNNDIDNEIYRLNGIKREGDDDENNPLAPKQCPRCEYVNPPEAKYCIKCGMPLTKEAQNETHANENKLFEILKENPQIAELLTQQLLTMTSNQTK